MYQLSAIVFDGTLKNGCVQLFEIFISLIVEKIIKTEIVNQTESTE